MEAIIYAIPPFFTPTRPKWQVMKPLIIKNMSIKAEWAKLPRSSLYSWEHKF